MPELKSIRRRAFRNSAWVFAKVLDPMSAE